MLLIIEGIDCVGKTTLCRNISLLLNKYKKTCYTNQFDTPFGAESKIRLINNSIDLIEDRIQMIRKCRKIWWDSKIAPKNLSKTNIIVDRFFLSLMAYQGLDGVIPIHSDFFEPEKQLSEELFYSSVLIYIRATDPTKMITTPRDEIEKKPPDYHKSLQERYDFLCMYYAPFTQITVHVTPEYQYNLSPEEIVEKILSAERTMLSSYDARQLKKRLKINHIFSCMRKAKKQRKLPF